MVVIGRRICRNCPRIAPPMILGVAVCERNDRALVMRAIRPIEEIVVVHIYAKVRPANAVGMDVHKEKQAAWHRPDDFRMLSKNLVKRPAITVERSNSVIPTADVADVNIQCIASDFWIKGSADPDRRFVVWTHVNLFCLKVIAKKSVLGI